MHVENIPARRYVHETSIRMIHIEIKLTRP